MEGNLPGSAAEPRIQGPARQVKADARARAAPCAGGERPAVRPGGLADHGQPQPAALGDRPVAVETLVRSSACSNADPARPGPVSWTSTR
jgi:hypothetical protein